MKSVVKVIACGGTIESTIDLDGTKRVTGGIENVVGDAQVVRFRCVPSFALTATDLLALAKLVADIASESTPIVTCGTDTLEDVAFVLDCVAPQRGVVITGAAISVDDDGLENLVTARIAAVDRGYPSGVGCVAFAGVIRAGRAVEESAPPPDIFEGSSQAPIGIRSGQEISWIGHVKPIRMSLPTGAAPTVQIVTAHVAGTVAHSDILSSDVLVIGGVGAGNMHPELWAIARRRIMDGGTTVLCSAHHSIAVSQVSREPGGGAALLELGAWSAGVLSPRKAVLASLLAGQGDERKGRFDRIVENASTVEMSA